MNRRGFLGYVVAAPAVILTPGLLMPVRSFGTSPVAAARTDVLTLDIIQRMRDLLIDRVVNPPYVVLIHPDTDHVMLEPLRLQYPRHVVQAMARL